MTIRPARAGDWPRIGELGEALVRLHHAYDPGRFVSPDTLPADVYATRLRDEIATGHATVLVADVDARIAGYLFASVEPESWKDFRGEAGYVHDLLVDEAHRRQGVAGALLASAIEWFGARGVTRVMLGTAAQNVTAQNLFRRAGFRPTMIEMMRDRP